MAKKIRFPLIMDRNIKVANLEELRAYFNMEYVLEYYKNGKLLIWLENLYLIDEAERIRELDEKAPDFQIQLCDIFQVEYSGIMVDMEVVEERQKRLARLRAVTDEDELYRKIDYVAFDQGELAGLLDEGATTIYLCQEEGEDFTFSIPVSCPRVVYIGIPCNARNPRVRISGGTLADTEKRGITLQSCDVEPSRQLVQNEEQLPDQEPFETFLEKICKKEDHSSSEDLTVSVRIAGTGLDNIQWTELTGSMAGLKETASALVQDALAEGRYIAGMEFKAGEVQYTLKVHLDADTATTWVKGIHIARGDDGSRMIYADLLCPVTLNGKRYRSIPILSAEIYQKLGLLEKSVIEIFRLGDMIPAIRMIEKGNGSLPRCPHCGSCFQFRHRVFCENPVCTDRLHGRIFRFLAKIGMKSCDRIFVQSLISELPVKSIGDLFRIDDVSTIAGEDFRDFPQQLREAVAGTPNYIVLSALGIPGLGLPQAKKIWRQYSILASQKNVKPWEYMSDLFDNILWDETIDSAVGTENSSIIQRWMRCDSRSIEIFRSDILELGYYVNTNEIDEAWIGSKLKPGSRVGFSGCRQEWYKLKDICYVYKFIAVAADKKNISSYDVLIVAHEGFSSSAVDTAKKMKIPIYTEKEFIEMFE